MKLSPRPWRFDVGKCAIVDADGFTVADMKTNTPSLYMRANIAAIVNAPRLLSALANHAPSSPELQNLLTMIAEGKLD